MTMTATSLDDPRIRFNWGFWDALDDVERGRRRVLTENYSDVQHVARTQGAYFHGYRWGLFYADSGYDHGGSSETAWTKAVEEGTVAEAQS